MTSGLQPIRSAIEEDGSLLRITLARPKGNVLDTAMIAAIRDALDARPAQGPLKSVLFDAEGPNFSYGASVEEHRPAEVGTMLRTFHDLFRGMARTGFVYLAALRGQCLGGGLELAAFCQRIFAAPETRLGNPEIRLGVFAPLASAVLPLRVGQARADELLLSGRSVTAEEAFEIGLVDEMADDPASAALLWHRAHLGPLSAVAVRHAARAARHHFYGRVIDTLEAVERQYLDELMSTHDAPEGINAFLDKRAPEWKHR